MPLEKVRCGQHPLFLDIDEGYIGVGSWRDASFACDLKSPGRLGSDQSCDILES